MARPVTNEEILEADTLIADMRDDLSLIVGTADADKLVSLMLEKTPRMIESTKSIRRFAVFLPVTGQRDYIYSADSIYDVLMVAQALAEMAERRLDYKAKLIDTVAKHAPRVEAAIEKIAQSLHQR